MTDLNRTTPDTDPQETREWLESLEWILAHEGAARARFLLQRLEQRARRAGVGVPYSSTTPYINTIPLKDQPPYPGDREIERRIKSYIRWNAMAMVVRGNKEAEGIGGHISTYASAATLYEVALNHFIRGPGADSEGDLVFYQGHASPGIYARAYMEGRLTEEHLRNFRRELRDPGGLPSYPHPWLLPNFWQFPTVSMGLGPIMAIYQARFLRYLQDRGLKKTDRQRVWVFMGDGETDEPESLGAITLPVREKLDNLIFVINCNLQRLDGPVRGNGKIIQELESIFRGAGWNVVKVIWSGDWDPLLSMDEDGLLVERMNEAVDGEFQKYSVETGDYIRKHFFGTDPRLLEMIEHLSDQQLAGLRRGGHDAEKVFAAYKSAVEHNGAPTVILAHTIKGYGLGEAGEGKNITHQQKKLNEEELREFRTRFGIPISDERVAKAPFYRPPEDSKEMEYLRKRREALGGYVPVRKPSPESLPAPELEVFKEFLAGSGDRPASTTAAFVRMLATLLRHEEIAERIVPIVPDEARTFGMEALFRQAGIYSHVGQIYDPVDSRTLLPYRESQDGQILEEGITEAGSISSWISAATSYAVHNLPMIPFYVYYSMFGFQRVGDLVWAAADMRARGFLCGGTAGRTTINGEGLQHQDGHSHLLFSAVPTCQPYDPAFAYEISVIIQDGIRRMMQEGEDIFYYMTLGNEPYVMPPMPEGVEEGIRRGLYRLRAAEARRKGDEGQNRHVALLGSGSIMNEAIQAADLLAEQFNVSADLYSATSYVQLRRNALDCERWNRMHPEMQARVPHVTETLQDAGGPVIAASDYLKALPDGVRPWVPQDMYSLGTDGFGRSDTREALRRHFEVDAAAIAHTALYALAAQGSLDMAEVAKAARELDISPDKPDPATAGSYTLY